MRVRIVCYEDTKEWIVGKFAIRLCEHLQQTGVRADISKVPEPAADINHHLLYGGYDGKRNSIDTMMITHIDHPGKVSQLAYQLLTAKMGICMSSDTMHMLTRQALPRGRLCFVNPAHDGVMKPRKLLVGITSKVQPGGCKREDMLGQLANHISNADFRFSIMGAGWDVIVEAMRSHGIEVDYCDHFDRNAYERLIPNLDYYLYFGKDEGSMGFLDALAAGVTTIVTPQGFHLDTEGGIVHSFDELDELVKVFDSIAEKRGRLVKAVETWTWSEYARKHLVIWRYLLARDSGQTVPAELKGELRSLGVALNRTAAGLQTLAYRVLRKGNRVVAKIKCRIGSQTPNLKN